MFELAYYLSVVSLSTLSALCLWAVWTHRLRTTSPHILILMVLWLAALTKLDDVLTDPFCISGPFPFLLSMAALLGIAFFVKKEILDRQSRHRVLEEKSHNTPATPQ